MHDITCFFQVSGLFYVAYKQISRNNDGGISQNVNEEPKRPVFLHLSQNSRIAWLRGFRLGMDKHWHAHKEQEDT